MKYSHISLPTRWSVLVALLLSLLAVTLSTPASSKSLWDYSLEELAQVRTSPLDHTLSVGETLIGYQYMHMDMRGLGDGRSDIGLNEFFSSTSYMVAPKEMTMDMHMLHIMHSPVKAWTLMAMIPYTELEMKNVMQMMMGGGMTVRTPFKVDNSGLGDIALTVLKTIVQGDHGMLTAKGTLSLPTGSISDNATTPMGKMLLPYPMRLGSGTFDLKPGLIYCYEFKKWRFGSAANATFRLGDNRKDYNLGTQWDLSAWTSYHLAEHAALNLRTQGLIWGNINGHDERLNPMMSPTADPHLRGGKRVDLLGGISLFSQEGALRGQNLSFEVGHPVYENLDGPQLKTRWQYTVDWTITF